MMMPALVPDQFGRMTPEAMAPTVRLPTTKSINAKVKRPPVECDVARYFFGVVPLFAWTNARTENSTTRDQIGSPEMTNQNWASAGLDRVSTITNEKRRTRTMHVAAPARYAQRFC